MINALSFNFPFSAAWSSKTFPTVSSTATWRCLWIPQIAKLISAKPRRYKRKRSSERQWMCWNRWEDRHLIIIANSELLFLTDLSNEWMEQQNHQFHHFQLGCEPRAWWNKSQDFEPRNGEMQTKIWARKAKGKKQIRQNVRLNGTNFMEDKSDALGLIEVHLSMQRSHLWELSPLLIASLR